MTVNPVASTALPYTLHDFARITADDWRSALSDGMAAQLAELDAIATDDAAPTAANVLDAWERTGALLNRAVMGFWTLKEANTTDALDAIEEEMSPKLAAHHDAILLDRRLYDRLVALDERARAGEVPLDEQEAWLLSEKLREYRRLGVNLPEDEQATLRELNERIATLEARWSSVVVAGRNEAAVHVEDASLLVGLTPEDLHAAEEAASRRGLAGWLLELVNTTGQPLLAKLENREIRRRLYEASVTRGLSGEHDTRPLIVELAQLRSRRAHVLGFAHHAEFAAGDGCAKTTEAVNAILSRVAGPAVRNAEGEAAELQEALAADHPGEALQPWDWQFYAERLRAERFSLDDEVLRPYLDFERVLVDGVFAAATGLYGITFVRRSDLAGYTDECRVFEVHDADDQPMALVVIDPYARPTKQGGAWMTSLVDQSELLGLLPVVTNNCNLVRPAPGKPTLMRWDSVITLFHEFGHDLHGLLSQVRYPSRSGTSTPRDFVEYPSQVNEMWAWDPALLRSYARHHETGEPVPQEWIDTLQAARHAGEGYDATEIFGAMILDQVWHQTPLDELPTSPDEVEDFEKRALAAWGIDVPLVPPRYRTTYFSHIWSGSYAAGYYSYLWSEVMDADTVAWFTENGGMTRANGDHFRTTLLSKGSSVDVMESYRRFRGADPDVRHVLERRGLA
ncbi:MAG TPA: M3 family metallopeptidase [Propionibacteriaceae bacterium]|nr:M3 family metallopeptidase [Propionibacteriaceae bacterium]